MAELCLGTVQFGMKYGINNKLGQPSKEAVFEMLDTAVKGGVRVIDTARAYGTAEILLGQYIESRKNADLLQIISKLRPNVIDGTEKDVYGIVRSEFEHTLRRLHVQHLDGYLLHTPQYIYNGGIIESLRRLKQEKLVDHIGVSIYDLDEGYAAIQTEEIDYIQLPYSILDQRGMQKGLIRKARENGITVFARSAFLQGLFMMEKERIPSHLQHVIPYMTKFEEMLEKYHVDKVTALMQFVLQEKDIDYLVFGVDTREQLTEDLSICKEGDVPELLIKELKRTFVDIEKSIIFPSLWSDGRKAE